MHFFKVLKFYYTNEVFKASNIISIANYKNAALWNEWPDDFKRGGSINKVRGLDKRLLEIRKGKKNNGSLHNPQRIES